MLQKGYQEGSSKWTVEQDKEYDPVLFRNGGRSYWETTQLPYVPPMPTVKKQDQVRNQGEQGVGLIFS